MPIDIQKTPQFIKAVPHFVEKSKNVVPQAQKLAKDIVDTFVKKLGYPLPEEDVTTLQRGAIKGFIEAYVQAIFNAGITFVMPPPAQEESAPREADPADEIPNS